jgi:hypothetical protein
MDILLHQLYVSVSTVYGSLAGRCAIVALILSSLIMDVQILHASHAYALQTFAHAPVFTLPHHVVFIAVLQHINH